jgi:hypothetical protein
MEGRLRTKENAKRVFQIRVRISVEDGAFVAGLAAETGLASVDLSTVILRAGIEAVRESGGAISLPLKLRVLGS